MPTPSSIDVIAPFDPTAYASISGAQLLQLVSGLAPYSDKGFIIASADVGNVPEVPDASVTTKWQRYVWLRIGAVAVTPYIWNDAAANHTDGSGNNIMKWYTIASASIGVGTITGAMIADNTITDAKIISLDFSKLTGVPAGSAPTGAAGGDLTGTYPNPSVGLAKIDNTKIAANTILDGNVQVGASPITGLLPNKISPSAVAFSQLRTNAGATAVEHFVPQLIVNTANPASAADVGKVVRVASPYTNGFELSSDGATVQRLVKNIIGHQTSAAVIPDDNTLPQLGEGSQIAFLSITPKSATNLIHVKYSVWVGHSAPGVGCTLALFKTGSTDSLQTVAWNSTDIGITGFLTLDWVGTAGVTTPLLFEVNAGPAAAGTSYINRLTAGARYGASDISFLQIEEYQGTLS